MHVERMMVWRGIWRYAMARQMTEQRAHRERALNVQDQ